MLQGKNVNRLSLWDIMELAGLEIASHRDGPRHGWLYRWNGGDWYEGGSTAHEALAAGISYAAEGLHELAELHHRRAQEAST